MQCCLDHISILVVSVEETAKKLAAYGAICGAKEVFDDVGTEEMYIGNTSMNALLLLQAAINDGVYKRALDKRGTGIHHIAIATDDFDGFNEKLGTLGWYIHPNSMKKYRKGKTVFYVKPGVHTIIELITKKTISHEQSFISEVLIAAENGKENSINGIGIKELKCSSLTKPYIILNSNKIEIGNI